MRDEIIKRNMIIIISSLLVFFFASLYIISYTNRKNLETELINVSNILFEKLDKTVSEEEIKNEINIFTNDQDWFYVVVTNSYGNYVIDSSTDENLEFSNRKLSSDELKLINKIDEKDRIYIDNQMIYYIYKLNDNIIIRTAFQFENNVEYILLSAFYMLILIIISFVTTIYLSNNTSNRIIEAFFKINSNLKMINDGKYEPIETSHRYFEVAEILEEINKNIYNHIITSERERSRISFIINNVKQGIIVIDENQKLMFVNSYAKKVLKIEELIEEDTIYSKYIDNRNFVDAYNKTCSNKIPIHIDYVDEEAERIYDFRFSFQKSNWQNQDVQLGMIFIIINDVTVVRKNDESKNEFISNASHELKTPITTILGFSELIMNGIGNCDQVVKDYINKIHNETIKMRNTINELLYLSNLDYRSPSIMLDEEVDLDQILSDLIYDYSNIAKEIGITFNYFKNGNVYIKGSESLIIHLFSNLIDNAIKYNKDNGMIKINLIENESTISVIIEDTGIGIPEAHIKNIFERFYRVDKSRSREKGGTGLGLSIVKKICMVHNANIKVTSKVNQGTTFEVVFGKNN